ncbi:MAG: TlpA disulfide reductase family protein [Chloroherpetonaceae bacterium]|nr:TlpA family protein disulfide reductase [Chthonomonadaceae bacterium]MDW8208496.1 TlpA disulfide reductase family protein [Chloroherpetonaceae bacterium]
MMRMRLLWIVLAISGAGLFFWLLTLHPPGMAGIRPAPDVALPLKAGAPPTRLSELKGKVVLLDFWATWCGPCRESIPELVRLQERYGARGLQVIGVSVDDRSTRDRVPDMQKQLGINYPIVFRDDIPGMEDAYTFDGIPTLFLIDRSGQIREVISGYNPSQSLEAKVEMLLDESAG